MIHKIPNFFEDRKTPWCFEDVLNFINSNFEINGNFTFRVGDKHNKPGENQNAGVVLAYAQLLDYTFNQVKALFSEHDHFAIAMPETRKGRNILEINNMFVRILKEGKDEKARINEFPELFDIPKDVLAIKNKKEIKGT